jgi:hypothetical protein
MGRFFFLETIAEVLNRKRTLGILLFSVVLWFLKSGFFLYGAGAANSPFVM